MTATTTRTDGVLRELSEPECWQYLSLGTVGRIAYVDRDGPVILPLNYVLHDGQIWIRTSSYNQLAIHVAHQMVAFEVDHVDEHARTGWSVLVRDRAEHAEREDERAIGRPDSAPWPDGIRSMTFRITPEHVTGRALVQGDVRPAAGHGPGTIQRSGS